MTPTTELAQYLKLRDYIDLAIGKNFMLWVLITSGAKGKKQGVQFDYGMGKSTFALSLMWEAVYSGNWTKVKRNTIGAYWEIKGILDREGLTLGVFWDDMQLTVGKDKMHNPEIKELAYYLTTVRPYVKVWVCTAPHRGMLHKDFRELFHIEIIVYHRGHYEVQVLKRLIDWKRPQNIKERFRYRGAGHFAKLAPEIQSWYSSWRHSKNLEIRSKLRAFKHYEATPELSLEFLTAPEKELVQSFIETGFIRYETLQRKGLALTATRLRRRGWLELDKDRRYQLTVGAEEVLLK